MKRALFVILAALALLASGALVSGSAAAAPDLLVTLIPDLPSGQAVGTPINWTISVDSPDPHLYQFSAGRQGEAIRIVYDYTPRNVLEWAPIEDGLYIVQAAVRNQNTGQVTTVSQVYLVSPRAVVSPVVSATANALVALYSAPSCPADYTMRVIFIEFGAARPTVTSRKSCDGAHTMNFYIGGMKEEGSYFMVHQVFDYLGGLVAIGPPRFFAAGTVPLPKPFASPYVPPGPQTSFLDNLVLLSPINGTEEQPAYPQVRDLLGRMVWYYDRNLNENQLFYPVPGGTFLIRVDVDGLEGQALREVDLAGHVVRETTTQAVDAQLKAMGFTDDFTAFHHEARLMPNGYYAILGYNERILVDVQGPGPIDVIGDYVVVLDENWQVVWAWNAFDHLDPYRVAVLGEVCQSQGPGCPPLFLATEANDWTHSNSISYTPDGNLIVSMRHQDWVIKINYNDGAGDGSVIWRLGPEGDFALSDADPYPWQTHQHDANYISSNRIILFDNGNTRCAANSELCYSRGQIYQLDEFTMTASLALNANLENYSFALGSAQRVTNGNFHFDSGIQPVGSELISTAHEVLSNGKTHYSLLLGQGAYRSFRMSSLYAALGEMPATDLINPLDYRGR